jgi:hypothetical protein
MLVNILRINLEDVRKLFNESPYTCENIGGFKDECSFKIIC